MTKVFLERDRDSMTITWENMNAYVPEEGKSFFSCFKKKADTIERRHIIQNGKINFDKLESLTHILFI